MAHCYKELETEEKWKNRDGLDASRKAMPNVSTMAFDEASSDAERSGTPHSVARTKRPLGKKSKDKGKKTGDDDIKPTDHDKFLLDDYAQSTG